jgi:hypothetical protein
MIAVDLIKKRDQIQTYRTYHNTERCEYDRATDPRPFDGAGNGAVNKNKDGKNG